MKFFEDQTVPFVKLPASKSVLLRLLLLAASTDEAVTIRLCGTLCDDTRAMIDCLNALGIDVREEKTSLKVLGAKKFPNGNAFLNVRESAATARFLAAAVAFCKKNATFFAAGTLRNRPMGILKILKDAGAEVTPLTKEESFPFRLSCEHFSSEEFFVDTDESTQYASALLLSAAFSDRPVTVHLKGARTESGYLSMTLSLLEQFGMNIQREQNKLTILPDKGTILPLVAEADLSAASYFCALAMLTQTNIFLNNANRSRFQPDDAFLSLLEQRGLRIAEFENGLLAEGSKVSAFEGFDCDFSRFSDQALTAAALAPFARTPSHLRGIFHIRRQECDRIQAIVKNLSALGVPVAEESDGVKISPAPVRPAAIETFGDHRVAMAFALLGAKTHVTIKNPNCCRKTFEDYFDILRTLHVLDIAFD